MMRTAAVVVVAVTAAVVVVAVTAAVVVVAATSEHIGVSTIGRRHDRQRAGQCKHGMWHTQGR